MGFPPPIKFGACCKWFFRAFLLACFATQAFIVGCCLIRGSIPLPPGWTARQIEQRIDGFRIEVAGSELTLKGELLFRGLSVFSEGLPKPLLEADYLVAEIKPGSSRFAWPVVEAVVVSGAKLHLPAVHAADGRRKVLLEKLSFRAKPSGKDFEITRIAALHGGVRLRGSLAWPNRRMRTEPAFASLDRFLDNIASILEKMEDFEVLERPTLAFRVFPGNQDRLRVDASLSSPRLQHPAITGRDLFLDLKLQHEAGATSFVAPPRFSVARLESTKLPMTAYNISGTVNRENWSRLFKRALPPLVLASERLEAYNVRLSDSRLRVDPSQYPVLRFEGATSGLKGGAALSGEINLQRRTGRVLADGDLDLRELIPQRLSARLPPLNFQEIPNYRLQLELAHEFSIAHASLRARVNDLVINDVVFDHVSARLALDERTIRADQIYIERGNQWIDGHYRLNREDNSYSLTAKGSIRPSDYNSMLPGWWARLFKDFHFTDESDGYGDFKIRGRWAARIPEQIFGRVEARHIGYCGIPLEAGSLTVRSHGRFTEMSDLNIRGEAGTVRGRIGLTTKADAVRAPASVRLDLRSTLRPVAAAKLFGPDIAPIIQDLRTNGQPVAGVKAALFHPAYPQYDGKDYFNLHFETSQPLRYRGVPFRDLSFQLQGRDRKLHLRDARFGYAEGEGKAEADMNLRKTTPKLRFDLALDNASQVRAVSNLPPLKSLRDDLSVTTKAKSDPENEQENRLDLSLRAAGPIDDPFQFKGFGAFDIQGEGLSQIDLLGPLSRALALFRINFTSLSLDRMRGNFALEEALLDFSSLEVNGPQTRVSARGTLTLPEKQLDMRVGVFLLANIGDAESPLRQVGQALNPIPNLLEFELTGTIEDQKWRSLYDPRNLIPDALNPGN